MNLGVIFSQIWKPLWNKIAYVIKYSLFANYLTFFEQFERIARKGSFFWDQPSHNHSYN